MNRRTHHKARGFTMIELMITLVILGIMTPVIFRFYHEGVKKRFDHLRESSHTLRGAQVLFKYLEQDLRHASGLIDSFGGFKTDKNTLIINTLSPKERVRLLKRAGDLAGDAPVRENDCIIVYRLDSAGGELVREARQGKIMLKSSIKKLSEEVEAIDIVYRKKGESGLVFVSHSFSKTALLGNVETLEYTYDKKRLKEASWVRLLISCEHSIRETQPKETFFRIFNIS
jgi:prepilin-type N-terminal cleavage/methylation domain-containing protein